MLDTAGEQSLDVSHLIVVQFGVARMFAVGWFPTRHRKVLSFHESRITLVKI